MSALPRYYFEEEIKGESSRKIHYISATDGLAAIYVQEDDENSLYYTYTDHLGSLVAIADEAGNPAERFSYDPWGNRRDPDDWTNRITTPVSEITGRGYTMHEHLDEFDLINMNGRVYDPLTSRFLSPDPYIQAPGQWLNYDRYAYAMNNPMLYTDPSGYFFKKFGNWLKKQWNEGWDALDQFATWADKTPWFPSSGGAGINSAGETWHYVGTSGPIYHNQLGTDYAGVVDAAISDAWERDAFLSGESLGGVAANGGGDYGWVETGFSHTGKTAYVAGLANKGRGAVEWEYLRQAKFNRSLSGNFSQPVKHSLRAISKTGKVLGVAGTVATYGVAGYQVATGTDNTSTWVDVGVTTGVVVVGIISAPVAIGAGIIYGGARLFYGDEIDGWIDENWGYR